MKISVDTKYTKYVSGQCKYFPSLNRNTGVVTFAEF